MVPADPDLAIPRRIGVAEAAAAELERHLVSQHPIIVAMGTGRTLRAAVEQLPPMDCPQHKIVSLVGNIAPDGSASFYDVIMPHRRRGEGAALSDAAAGHRLDGPRDRRCSCRRQPVRNVIDLAAAGRRHLRRRRQIGDDAPLLQDGFVKPDEMRALVKAGAVGEIVGWAFDADGTADRRPDQRPGGERAARPAGAPPGHRRRHGRRQAPGRFAAALRGKLINGLITNETTAELARNKWRMLIVG